MFCWVLVADTALQLAKQMESRGKAPAKFAVGALKQNVYREVLAAVDAKGARAGGEGRRKGHAYAPPPPRGRL